MLDEHTPPLFQSHRNRLVRAATRILAGRAEAEDAVQDSYLRALEAAAGGKPDAQVAQAWLTTVMQNLAIDRLRRRDWMRNWLREAAAQAVTHEMPSAEDTAALAQHTDQALRLLAARLGPADGAAVLLREVFEASYRELAQASGKTEAGCRQQLHRALMRLRGDPAAPAADDAETDAVFHLYRQALMSRDMLPLLAMLRQAPTRALAHPAATTGRAAETPRATCQVTHVGGRLGLVLTLGDQFVCVLPLGALDDECDEEKETALARHTPAI